MYDQPKLSEFIRFARVDAGSTVIDVYPGDGDFRSGSPFEAYYQTSGYLRQVLGFIPCARGDAGETAVEPFGEAASLAAAA